MGEASGARDQEARDTEPLIPANSITSECSPPPCMVIPSSTAAEIDMVVGSGGFSGGDDLEAASAPSCRICLECDCDNDDELISPCMCKGTQQFVHRSCLDHWRSVKEGFAFSHCTTCKAQYHLRVVSFETNSWRSLKFRLFVARDLLLGLLAIQTVISAIGAFAYLMDKDGAFRNSFSDGWDAILSRHPIPFYYCIGVVIFFVVLGFCGLVAQCLLCCGAMPQTDGPGYGSAYVCYAFNPWGDCSCTGCMMESAGGASMEGCLVLAVVFVVILALLGIVYGFIVATMGVQHVWQRHYHILTKRELTKEYIVEDQHGSYTPPKLDSEQEERLRVLKLL